MEQYEIRERDTGALIIIFDGTFGEACQAARWFARDFDTETTVKKVQR